MFILNSNNTKFGWRSWKYFSLSFQSYLSFFKFYKLEVLLFLLVHLNISTVECLSEAYFKNEICDRIEYFEPYAKFYKTRKGAVIEGIYKTDFMDLRSVTGLLCINGPAILYQNYTYPYFIHPEPQVFSHDCFGINRQKKSAYKSGEIDQPINADTKIYGNKIFGVFLIGDARDFRRTEFRWFRHPVYGFHTNEKEGGRIQIQGGSFGIVVNDDGKYDGEIIESPPGSNPQCFNVTDNVKGNVEGTVKGDIKPGDKPQFCLREEEEPESYFDEVFYRGLTSQKYSFWSNCDGDGGAPDVMMTEVFPDFRIIDPKDILSGKKSPGKVLKPKVKNPSLVPFIMKPFPPGYFKPTTSKPGMAVAGNIIEKSVYTEAKDCEDLPEYPTPCGDSLVDEDEGCNLIKRILTIEEINWFDSNVTYPNTPPDPTLIQSILISASWRKQLFDLIIKIYQKACPQVSKGLAPGVIRVLEHFIDKIAEDVYKTYTSSSPATTVNLNPAGFEKFDILHKTFANLSSWNETLAPELQNCLTNSVSNISLYRTINKENEQLKKDIEIRLEQLYKLSSMTHYNISSVEKAEMHRLEDLLRDKTISFPYNIRVIPSRPIDNKKSELIGNFTEAAEVDYNLDWGIDTAWKVFSTVMGYCGKFFSNDTLVTQELYTRSTEDVFDLVLEQWAQEDLNKTRGGETYLYGNYEQVYDQLFGEFINGVASRYIDACHNGAYYDSNVGKLRLARPLNVRAGPVYNSSFSNETFANFLTENPFF